MFNIFQNNPVLKSSSKVLETTDEYKNDLKDLNSDSERFPPKPDSDMSINVSKIVAREAVFTHRLYTDGDNLYYTRQETDALLNQKQDTLESGVNIKTVNSVSVLGSGDIPCATSPEGQTVEISIEGEGVLDD